MPRRYCFVRVESMNFMGERHLEKKHLALHVIKEVQIKSSEVQSSPKSWQRFGHMMRSSVIVNKVNLAR
nr:hypothetical protein CFP56_41775 [Quercus suber]